MHTITHSRTHTRAHTPLPLWRYKLCCDTLNKYVIYYDATLLGYVKKTPLILIIHFEDVFGFFRVWHCKI